LPNASDPSAPTDQDPIADTPDAAQDDTDQNTPAAPDEYQGRLQALQAEVQRRFPGEPPPQPTGDSKTDYLALQRDFSKRTSQPKPETQPIKDTYKDRWEESERTRAVQVFGLSAKTALEAAKTAYANDPTPFGEFTSYEVYHQKRLEQEGAPKVPPKDADERPDPTAPRVDSNSSDVSSDLSVKSNTEARRGDQTLLEGVTGLLKKAAWSR
jgi:hypothetical protein